MAHWTDKRKATEILAHALRDKGWTLFGYHKDESDSMTDYYSPATWYGCATHSSYPGVVVVCSRGLDYSGHQETEPYVASSTPCTRCNGTGAEPEGWTIERAQQDPKGFNGHRDAVKSQLSSGQIITLFGHVVSPHDFLDDGRECCQGSGCYQGQIRTFANRVTQTWPSWTQETPKGALGHVERDGQILCLIRGVAGLSSYDAQKRQEAVQDVLDRIDRTLLTPKGDPQPQANVEGQAAPAGTPLELSVAPVEVRPGKREGYVEVVFPAKPPVSIREALKGAGFRWNSTDSCWWGRQEALPAGLGS